MLVFVRCAPIRPSPCHFKKQGHTTSSENPHFMMLNITQPSTVVLVHRSPNGACVARRAATPTQSGADPARPQPCAASGLPPSSPSFSASTPGYGHPASAAPGTLGTANPSHRPARRLRPPGTQSQHASSHDAQSYQAGLIVDSGLRGTPASACSSSCRPGAFTSSHRAPYLAVGETVLLLHELRDC